MENKAIQTFQKLNNINELRDLTSYHMLSLWHLAYVDLYKFLRSPNMANGEMPDIKTKIPMYILSFRSFVKYFILVYFAIKRFSSNMLFNKKGIDNFGGVIAISPSIYRKNYPAVKTDKKPSLRDAMLGDIIQSLVDRKIAVKVLDVDNSAFRDISNSIENQMGDKNILMPIEFYISPRIITEYLRDCRKYEINFKRLKTSGQFRELRTSSGISLYPLIFDYFDTLFRSRFYLLSLYTRLIMAAIEVEKPAILLIACSYCVLGKAAIVAGSLKGIPILEMQHGEITESHVGYMYDNVSSSCSRTFPNTIAVFGKHYKDVLISMGGFAPSSIIVTGSPRYDSLAHYDTSYSRKELLQAYSIDEKNKIVLWTTQSHGLSMEENEINYKAIFSAIEGLNNVTLVIKQHPNEGAKYEKIMRERLKEFKISYIMPSKDSNTFELIFACDIMITKYSTTAIEAIALNKSVIILNLSDEPDRTEYVKKGVAIGVYNENNLKWAIEGLLNKEITISAFMREKFLEDMLYKMDGRSADRVADIIEKMVRV